MLLPYRYLPNHMVIWLDTNTGLETTNHIPYQIYI
jgi:hypothetical protein